MKKKFVLLMSILFVIVLFFLLILRQKKQYEEMFNRINQRKVGGYYDIYYMQFFDDNFECPQNTNEIIDSSFSKEDIKFLFEDPLSRKKELIKYIPIHNRNNLNREGFVLLSSGIDGKFNHRNLLKDTLYIDNFYEKLNLYNNNFNRKNIIESDTVPFNCWQLLFGSKDYLIQYYNCVENFKHKARGIHPIEKLERIFGEKRIRRNVFGFKGICSKNLYDELEKEQIINFNLKNFTVRCNFYNKEDAEIFAGDSVAIIGRLKFHDLDKKILYFDRCIKVDLDYNPWKQYLEK